VNRRTLLKGGAVAVALAALGVGGAVHWRRGKTRTRSDVITGAWDQVAQGHWLLPNLRDARMVVPDRPHSHAEAMDPALKARITRVRSFGVNTNAWRARGVREIEAKAAGTFRVLCLGDSVTFGWGVEDEQSWPALVEGQLRDRGVQAEVLNFGVPAQQIHAMCTFLTSVGSRLDVDAVVIAERQEQGQTAQMYAQGVRKALRSVPRAKALLALPPISRFDPMGRQNYEREVSELTRAMGSIPVIDLTRRLWAAQTETGCDLVLGQGELQVVRRGSGEVVLDTPWTGGNLPDEVYALFEEDETVREPLFFDAGHPDAEGFVPFAEGVVEAMAPWFS